VCPYEKKPPVAFVGGPESPFSRALSFAGVTAHSVPLPPLVNQ
jgi:hypothetical protein